MITKAELTFLNRDTLWILCLVSLLGAGPIHADDGDAAPPVVYTLVINGKRHEISPDQPVTITGAFVDPTVTLQVATEREFNAAGVSFQYPAYFTYEADTDDSEVRTWTLSGNDVTVILFQFSDAVTPKDLTTSTAEALDGEIVESQPITLQLGDKKRQGSKPR